MRFNIFGQSSEASGSSSASTASAASASASVRTAEGSTARAPKMSRSDIIIKDEQEYQAKQYPTSEELPGCMQLFWMEENRPLTWPSDEFMMCYALMPQLRSFYRQGEFRDCTWKWHDFKYCLSLKSASGDERRQLWIKRRADWWAARRLQGSSEDVWDLRTARQSLMHREPLENFPPLWPEEPVPAETTI